MRLLLQRVTEASVTVAGDVVAAIGPGLLVLVGFGQGDGAEFSGSALCRTMLEKVCDLRIFPDGEGRLNRSLRDTHGELLLVSQFTLYAACRKGRRPSFSEAAAPEPARELYEAVVRLAAALLPGRVASGIFGADMDVRLNNQGPVTILLDSADFATFRPS